MVKTGRVRTSDELYEESNLPFVRPTVDKAKMDAGITKLIWNVDAGPVQPRGKRRSHAKSRRGCAQCKASRIKCDEVRPTCEQCQHRRRKCDYSNLSSVTRPVQTRDRDESALRAGTEMLLTTMSRTLSRMQIHTVLCQASTQCHSLPVDQLASLDHFVRTTHPWIGATAIQEGLQTLGMQLAMQVPSLLHNILAFSNSHLAFLFPGERRYAVAAAACFQQALHLYLQDLGACRSLDSQHLDGLFGSNLLITMLGFVHADIRGETERTLINFGWVATMQGMPALLSNDVARRHHATSTAWSPIWARAASLRKQTDWPPLSSARAQRNDILEATFRQICELKTDGAKPDGNPYEVAVEQLMLLWTKSSNAIISNLVFFVAQLPKSFVRLLETNEDRAMLIMSHWCARALLSNSGAPQWWLEGRCTELCWRICSRLSNSKHPGIRLLLEEPARACGYPMLSFPPARTLAWVDTAAP